MATKKKPAVTENKEIQREDPEFLPTTYGLTKNAIRKLKAEYDPETMPEALIKGDDGYEVVHKKAMAIVKVRTFIEKKKKELTDDARAWTTKVNGEAKRLTEIVAAIEKPWKDKKAELDKAEEIKAEKERMAELARTDAIELKINAIINTTANLVGARSDELRERVNLINTIIVDSSYDEYEATASEHKEQAIESLSAALKERELFEAQQLQMDKDRLEIEEGKAELAKAKAEIERLQKNNLIDSPQENNQQHVSNYANGSVEEFFGNEPNSNQQEILSEQSAVNSEDAEPYIAMTEPQMVDAYMLKLINVEVPDVGDELMVNTVEVMTANLQKLKRFIETRTQGE